MQADFSALIAGVRAKRFDVASGGLGDSEEREAVLDFVNYFKSGFSFLILTENEPNFKSVTDFCGRTVSTTLGGRNIIIALEKGSADCVAAGKGPIKIEQYPATPDARIQLDLKRSDAFVSDYPGLAFILTQYPGKYAIAGGDYTIGYGILSWAFTKEDAALRNAFQAAAQSMLKDGTYKAVLDKWNMPYAALKEITINLPPSKRDK